MGQVSFTETKPPVREEDIARVEGTLGCKLPIDYRRFLLENSGGRPSLEAFDVSWDDNPVGKGWGTSLIHFFLSVHDGRHSNLVKYNTGTFRGRIPRETIAMAYDQSGNLVLMGVGEANLGHVHFWIQDHAVEEGTEPDYSNVGRVAKSFSDFLSSLYLFKG